MLVSGQTPGFCLWIVFKYILLPCWLCINWAPFRNVTGSRSKNSKKNNKIYPHTRYNPDYHLTQWSGEEKKRDLCDLCNEIITFLVFAHAPHYKIMLNHYTLSDHISCVLLKTLTFLSLFCQSTLTFYSVTIIVDSTKWCRLCLGQSMQVDS